MQARHSGVVVVGIALLAVACAKPSLVRPAANKSEAIIEIICHDGGYSSAVVPNTIYWDEKTKSVTWSLTAASTVTGFVVGPKGTNEWPFTDAGFPTTPGNSVKGKTLKTGLSGGTYKYIASGVCTDESGVKYPVVIDPDMIIPKTAFSF